MKKILISLFICITFVCNSQNKEYDIYILIESNSKIKIANFKNDSVINQLFILPEKIDPVTKKVTVNKDGKLIVLTQVRGSMRHSVIKLMFENIKDVNSPFVIKKNQLLIS